MFDVLNLEDVFNMPPKEWMVEGLFGPGDKVMLFGESGAGKSFVALDLMIRGVLGEPACGVFPITRTFTSICVTAEGLG